MTSILSLFISPFGNYSVSEVDPPILRCPQAQSPPLLLRLVPASKVAESLLPLCYPPLLLLLAQLAS